MSSPEEVARSDLDQLQAQVTQLEEKITELTVIIEALQAENALKHGEVLNERQRKNLSEYNFINYLEAHKDYYSLIVRAIETTFVQRIHVYRTRPLDLVAMLGKILENDPMFNQYIESRVWIGDDTQPLFADLFARLIISEGI